MFTKILILAAAGATGTITRYALGGWIHRFSGFSFPIGTFAVNAVGCVVIGFLGTLADERSLFSSEWRVALILGFLGAFTTYSSFAYETWVLLKNGELLFASLNIFGSLIICFAGLFLGVWLARVLY